MATPNKTTKTTKTTTPPSQQAVATYDWGSTGVTGFENTKADDLGIPFLQIVQKGSPEVDKTHPNYATKKIEGCEPGDIINTITRQIVGSDGNPAVFIPCSYERAFVEWKSRESGGGMVRQHATDAILSQTKRDENNRDVLPNGNVIVTTGYFLGLLVNTHEDGTVSYDKCVLSMTSTQLKKARLWLNMMMSIKVPGPNGTKITPPMFSHKYNLSTIVEQNAEGSWFGWLIESAGMLTNPDVITLAVDTAKQVAAGRRPQLSAPSDNVPM